MTPGARELVLERFAWVGGHADVWAVFRDGEALRQVVTALAEPLAGDGLTAVCGIESRGFLLGAAVAVELGVGFVAVRKAGGLLPGAKAVTSAMPDYRGTVNTLRVQRSSAGHGDRLVLVDDWIETGSQLRATRDLLDGCGAELVAYSVIVDDLPGELRTELGRGHAIVRSGELPDDPAA